MTGEWVDQLVPDIYVPTDPELLAPDPAHYAIANGLVDVHTPANREVVGAWRWRGLIENKDRIIPILKSHRVIDFGGAAGRIGYGSQIVDAGDELHKSLWDLPGEFDCLFSSHTLEHIVHLKSFLGCVLYRLERPATVITYVPSQTLVHLRAENFPHHCHTFCLSTDPIQDEKWIPLDQIFSVQGFKLEHCVRCSDGCLFCIARLEGGDVRGAGAAEVRSIHEG